MRYDLKTNQRTTLLRAMSASAHLGSPGAIKALAKPTQNKKSWNIRNNRKRIQRVYGNTTLSQDDLTNIAKALSNTYKEKINPDGTNKTFDDLDDEQIRKQIEASMAANKVAKQNQMTSATVAPPAKPKPVPGKPKSNQRVPLKNGNFRSPQATRGSSGNGSSTGPDPPATPDQAVASGSDPSLTPPPGMQPGPFPPTPPTPPAGSAANSAANSPPSGPVPANPGPPAPKPVPALAPKPAPAPAKPPPGGGNTPPGKLTMQQEEAWAKVKRLSDEHKKKYEAVKEKIRKNPKPTPKELGEYMLLANQRDNLEAHIRNVLTKGGVDLSTVKIDPKTGYVDVAAVPQSPAQPPAKPPPGGGNTPPSGSQLTDEQKKAWAEARKVSDDFEVRLQQAKDDKDVNEVSRLTNDRTQYNGYFLRLLENAGIDRTTIKVDPDTGYVDVAAGPQTPAIPQTPAQPPPAPGKNPAPGTGKTTPDTTTKVLFSSSDDGGDDGGTPGAIDLIPDRRAGGTLSRFGNDKKIERPPGVLDSNQRAYLDNYQDVDQDEKGDYFTHNPTHISSSDTLRPTYGMASANDVIPSTEDQLASDIRFDMFSQVPDGFGQGQDNKLFLMEQNREAKIRYMAPLDYVGSNIGPIAGVTVPPWQLQRTMKPAQTEQFQSRKRRRLSDAVVTLEKNGANSLSLTGYDKGFPYNKSCSGLRRDMDSPLEPVIRTDFNWEHVKDPTGNQLNKKQFRLETDAQRMPRHLTSNASLMGGPTLSKKRGLEVILP